MSNAVEQELMKVEREQSSVKNKGRLVFSDCGITGFDWTLTTNNAGEWTFFKSPATDGLMTKEDFLSFDHQYKDDFRVKKFWNSRVWEKTVEKETIEMVDHPKHYQSKNGVEVIDVIEEFNLGFHLGNVIKYILCAGHKNDELEDLEKAKWYLDRVIELKKTENKK